MATATHQPEANAPAIARPRLPYHPALRERYEIDQGQWRVLVDAIFPAAQSIESVIMALGYCRARKLDIFKRAVHIVPIWDDGKKQYVETVWPSIAELRTTAFRTGEYAGHEATVFGPDVEHTWGEGTATVRLVIPEWAQVTVYRIVQGQRCPFPGPRVYWLESYAKRKGGYPNAMWEKRPRGQLDKCALAAALRDAFPEEIGGDITSDEAEGITIGHQEVMQNDASVPIARITKAQQMAAELEQAAQRKPSSEPVGVTNYVSSDPAFEPDPPPPSDEDQAAEAEARAALEEWRLAVAALSSDEAIKEFRQSVLPTVPTPLREAVEKMLAGRELKLKRKSKLSRAGRDRR